MKTKALIMAILLLLGYEAWLKWAQPFGGETLTFSQGNFIRAQQFVHGFKNHKVLYCGSSLSWPMTAYLTQQDPKEVCCLGFVGFGARDGLEIVERSGARPGLIMLEMNHLERRPEKAFHKDLFNPLLHFARNHFSALRHGFQPATMLVVGHERGFKVDTAPNPQEARPRLPEDPIPEPVEAHREPAEVEKTSQEIVEALTDVRTQVERLESRGIVFGFYEVPEHPDVTASPALQRVRDALKEAFPEREYGALVRDPVTKYYICGDGEHLQQEDAGAFAYFLLEEARLRLRREHLTHLPAVIPTLGGR